jgi:hypothetical protein
MIEGLSYITECELHPAAMPDNKLMNEIGIVYYNMLNYWIQFFDMRICL